jgi:predicted nucleic acid-binding protein
MLGLRNASRSWIDPGPILKDDGGSAKICTMAKIFIDTNILIYSMDQLVVKDILNSLERFETVIIVPDIIKDAIDCSIINRLSFWDALIITAAGSANCEKLWSEDLNDGQVIRGVLIENPLKEEK